MLVIVKIVNYSKNNSCLLILNSYICLTMLQQEEFINRLKILLEQKQLSSSSFADTISVPRSSISHLLSGRNKPSLEFVMKIVHSYPDVDINWLLFGKESISKHSSLNSDSNTLLEENFSTERHSTHQKQASDVEKIVVFYKNGVFKEYKPS